MCCSHPNIKEKVSVERSERFMKKGLLLVVRKVILYRKCLNIYYRAFLRKCGGTTFDWPLRVPVCVCVGPELCISSSFKELKSFPSKVLPKFSVFKAEADYFPMISIYSLITELGGVTSILYYLQGFDIDHLPPIYFTCNTNEKPTLISSILQIKELKRT